MQYDSLFRPFVYKNLELKNRFVMAPMTRAFSPDGVPNQAVADYYSRRAANVGLILTEGTVVNRPASKNVKDIPDFYGHEPLAGWKTVVDGVHAAGGAIGPQIWHTGDVAYPGWSPEAPLDAPDTMSAEDIHDTIQAFAKAAKDAQDLGFDMIELHGAHGYLIDEFFWEGKNHRSDEWGGKTLKERSRFAVEIVKAIRQAVGPEMVIDIRLSQWKQQDYTARLAHTPREMEDWILPLAEAGVDIFHASQRRYWEPEFEGSDLNTAGWMKKITGKPTITVGSVGLSGDFMKAFAGESSGTSDLNELVRRFDRGDFDLVAVGRAILQDPQWVQKVKEGKTTELKSFEASSMGVLH